MDDDILFLIFILVPVSLIAVPLILARRRRATVPPKSTALDPSVDAHEEQ